MTTEQMRDYISSAYPGYAWKHKCSCMKNNQIIAIFYSLQDRYKKKEARQVKQDKAGVQLTIFDMLKEDRNSQ